MTLVDIEQEMQFVYYDDKHKTWRQKTGTIAEFLKIYCDYQLKLICSGWYNTKTIKREMR